MTELSTCPSCGKQVKGSVDASTVCPHCGSTCASIAPSVAGTDTAAHEAIAQTFEDGRGAAPKGIAPGTVADIELVKEPESENNKTFVAGDRTIQADDLAEQVRSQVASYQASIADAKPVPAHGTVADLGVDSDARKNRTLTGDEALFTLVDPEIASQLLSEVGHGLDERHGDPTKTIVAAERTIQGSDLKPQSPGTVGDEVDLGKIDRTIQGGATIIASVKASESAPSEGDDSALISVHERSFVPYRENVAQRGSDYELMKMLGEGGMGVVYAARQASIDRVVAVKMLKPESVNHSGQRSKFLAEAAVTGELEHPNIVPIYDLGKNASGALFYAMKRVQGTPWHKQIASMSTSENLDVLMRVADAIAFAHARGVIHRDLKPENVMLGGYGEVLVMDWGLALPVNRRSAGGIQIKPTMGGTPAYMAPEMATGPFDKLSFASDIYLLGAILFEIVTGKPPHSGVTVMKCLVSAARNEIAATNKTGELLDIAMKAMETDPGDRYASVIDFQQAIRDYRNHLESIMLADRAHEDLTRAAEREDYSDFSRAVFGFEESLSLWAENKRARQGLIDAKLGYAKVAKNKGDFDLAASLLDASIASHATVLAEVNAAVEERAARERRMASMKRVAVGMAATMFVVISAALLYVINANRNERIARKDAETARETAETAKKAEEVQRANAERNALIAEENRVKAVESAEIAEANRKAAEESALIAEENRLAAEESAMIAEERRKEAVEAQMAAEAAQLEEERARKLADEQRMRAVEAQEKEAMARLAAEEAERETARALEEEAVQRRLADERRVEAIEARDEAQRQRELAEYEAYVARINAASAKIDEQNFDQARTLLQACEPDENETDYRGWEWYRLWYLCHQSQRDISLELPAESICFSPDGKSFVVGGMDGEAQIRATDGSLIDTLEATGSRILAADWSDQSRVLPGVSRTALTSVSSRAPGLIALGSDDRTAPIQLFDAQTGEPIELLDREQQHTDAVTCLQFSTDQSKLLSASFDRTIKVWDLNTGKVIQTLVGHRLWVWSARFSPDEKFVVSASEDGTARVWNLETSESSQPFLGHEGPVYTADFSPDGRWVASGGIDGLLLQWDWNERSLSGFDHRQAIRDFQAGRAIEARTLRGLRILAGHTAAIRSVRFSTRDEETVIVSTGHDHTIRLWNLETGVEQGTLRGHGRWVRCCDISPDGAWIISAGFDGIARLWENGQSGETQVLQAQTLQGHDDSILDAAFSLDGSSVLTASRDRTARQWATESGELQKTYQEGHSFLTRRVVVHPDGESMITAAVDGTARVWNVQEGLETKVWPETGRTGVLAITSSGTWVLTGDAANGIQLHAFDADVTIHPQEAHAAPVSAAAFSPDALHWVTGDERGRLVLWSSATEDLAASEATTEILRHHTDRVTDLVWISPTSFVSTSRDRTAVVWNVADLANPWIISSAEEFSAAALLADDRFLLLSRVGEVKLMSASQKSELNSLNLIGEAAGDNQPNVRASRIATYGSQRAVVVDEGRKSLYWMSITDDQLKLESAAGAETSPVAVGARAVDVSDAAFSLDGSALVVVGGAASQLVDVEDAATSPQGMGTVRRRYESQDVLSSLALSQQLDELTLVTASWDGSLFVWDVEEGIVEQKLEQGHAGRVTSVSMSESGQWIASGDDRGRLVIWDRGTGTSRVSVELGPALHSNAFVPVDDQGNLGLLVGNEEGSIMLVSLDGKELVRWQAHSAAVLAISVLVDDGTLKIASSGADNIAKAWTLVLKQAQLPTMTAELIGHSAAVNDIDWSPDGERLVTASDDFTVKLWDADTSKELLTLRGHDREVSSAQFDPQGARILSAAHDGLAIVWLTGSSDEAP